MEGVTVLVRCSDDPRFEQCLDSIDEHCEVIAALTPNAEIEGIARQRGVRYALSPRGNPAATTNAALPLCGNRRVVLIDSDCVFLPGAIRRITRIAMDADVVRPTIRFRHVDRSSRATALARDFQYSYCGFIYEPGLLIDLERTLPRIGGYLFSPCAPYTPDGEFDYRVRRSSLRVATDTGETLVHDALSFRGHLRSYWRYGASEASRMTHLQQPVLREVLAGLPFRYRSALSRKYPAATLPCVVVCDALYITSMLYHLAAPLHYPGRPT